MPGVAVKLSAAPIALLHSSLYASDAGRVMTTKAVALLVTVAVAPPPPPLEIKSMRIESI